jgi:hypothetical protein
MVQFLFDFVSLFLEERCHVVLTPKGEIYIYIYIYIYIGFFTLKVVANQCLMDKETHIYSNRESG